MGRGLLAEERDGSLDEREDQERRQEPAVAQQAGRRAGHQGGEDEGHAGQRQHQRHEKAVLPNPQG